MKSLLPPVALWFAISLGTKADEGIRNSLPFTVETEIVGPEDPRFRGAPRIHSFAFAQSGGRWLFIGGRANGFHGFRAPDNSFPRDTANAHIWVVDTNPGASRHVYSFPVQELTDTEVQDQWFSTNVQDYQDGDTLYIVGGYGMNVSGLWVTFPTITAFHVPSMIRAVMEGDGPRISNLIRKGADPRLQVTGGGLLKLRDGFFYLVMGHTYQGRYQSRLTIQTYTEAIRRFKIAATTAGALVIEEGSYTSYRDPANFHRRDLNVTRTILSDGTEGIGAYGGVFIPPNPTVPNSDQPFNPDANLPWKYPVYIGTTGIRTDYGFEQRMSAYNCAHLLIYDPIERTMYTTFFGGIGHYYYDQTERMIVSAGGPPGTKPDPLNPGQTIFDDVTPFIFDVTSLARRRSGRTVEIVHPRELPGFLGSEARLINDPALETEGRLYSRDIIDFRKLRGRTFVGYVFGGIRAFPRAGYEDWRKWGQFDTVASDVILEVFVTPRCGKTPDCEGADPIRPPRPDPRRAAQPSSAEASPSRSSRYGTPARNSR